MDFKNKKILFIGPVFHDYHSLIIEKLEQLGAIVTFVPERDYSILFKIVNNAFHCLLALKQRKHYRNISIEGFDFLFVIRGYMMLPEFVERFKKANPSAKTILYQWDSAQNNPYAKLIPHFDVVKSFDYKDCKDFQIEYLPLFFTDDVALAVAQKHERKYDLFFIGSYIAERYEGLVKLRECLKGTPYTLKSFLYIAPTTLKKEKMKGTQIDTELISTVPMSRAEYLDTLNSSSVIVDVSSSEQTGLAMRVIEAIASRRKILTTNTMIVNEPFYDKNNIAVFDINCFELDADFINSEFQGQTNILSISDWVKSLFSIL